MKRYEDIRQVFNLLNASGVDYLVLRNYEMMLSPELFVGDHADIDLLCEDSQKIVQVLGACSTTKNDEHSPDDGIHYFLNIRGQVVSFDLRQVGDGYYCEQWERDLLNRKKFTQCFYVLSDEDYFYTLIYHAVLQKRKLSEEYRNRLMKMASMNGASNEIKDEKGFICLLEKYMKNKGYRFVYSHDFMVPNRFHLVDSQMVEKDFKLWLAHFLFDTKVTWIEFLVKVKHCIKL